MRKLKHILSIILALTLVFSVSLETVFAQESIKDLADKYLPAVDMDRIFEYDFVDKKVVEDTAKEESVVEQEAFATLFALDIMSPLSDGTIGENQFVLYKDFAKIMYDLFVGKDKEIFERYDSYGTDRYTTCHEAAYYLVGLTGYAIYSEKYNTENPRSDVAGKIGLLDGIKFNGNKNITRGELARMIFNALNIDMLEQVSFGDTSDYEVVKGQTLLSQRYSAMVVNGMVTAQNGVNIYSNEVPEENIIEIERVPYCIDFPDVDDMLGHEVNAIIKENKNGKHSVISIIKAKEDKTIVVDFDDIEEITTKRLSYVADGEVKKCSVKLDKLCVDGKQVSVNDFNVGLLNLEGELRLCYSFADNAYNCALVFNRQDYVVRSVSLVDEKIFLKHGMLFESNGYIDISSDKTVLVNIDGKRGNVTALKAGQVISVTGNIEAGCYTINASNKKVIGAIAFLETDGVIIEDERYAISPDYNKATMIDKSLPKLEPGLSGTFYLNCNNKIVSYKKDINSEQYAFLREFGQTQGFDSEVILRMFTQDGVWQEFTLADKLVFDGVDGTTKEVAFEKMCAHSSEVVDAIIRFKATKDGKITFLDTSRIKTGSDAIGDPELDDESCVSKVDTWNNKHNWTVTYEHSCLLYSKYMMMPSTIIFKLPIDLENEAMYKVINPALLTIDSMDVMDIYSVDPFFVVNVAVSKGGASLGPGASKAIVSEIRRGVNDDGEDIYTIKAVRNKELRTLSLVPEISDKAKTLQLGDIIKIAESNGTIVDFEELVGVENWYVDEQTGDWGGDAATVVGNVVSVDPERELIKFVSDGVEYAGYASSVQIFDSSAKTTKQRGMNATLSDVREGDRVFISCSVLWVVVYVLR